MLSRKMLCGLLLFAAAPANAQELRWSHDLSSARRAAQQQGRPLFLDFGTVNCFWCTKLDATTFRDPAVVKLLTERFVPCKIDASRDPALAQSMNVNAYPTLIVVSADGKILARHDGYADAASLLPVLRKTAPPETRLPTPVASVPSAPTPTAPVRPVAAAIPTSVTLPPPRYLGVTIPTPNRDHAAEAQQLLLRAREDFEARCFAGCLERCHRLSADYADLPEARDAQNLVAVIRGDANHALRESEVLAELFAESLLAKADAAMRQGQVASAIDCLQRVQQCCPTSRHARTAESQLARLRKTQPIIRAQAP